MKEFHLFSFMLRVQIIYKLEITILNQKFVLHSLNIAALNINHVANVSQKTNTTILIKNKIYITYEV